jgi:hypothetical protein
VTEGGPFFVKMSDSNYLSILLLLCAVGLFLWRKRSYGKALSKSSYPAITGKVLHTSVREEVDESDTDGGVNTRTVTYHPVIRYTYSVDGKAYENDRYSVLEDGRYSDWESAQEFVSKFPVGGNVTVYYNPKSPKDSFLDMKMDVKGYHLTTWFMVGVLVVLALVFSLIG